MGKLPYKKGTLFAIPLRSGGYGLGLVARMAPKGKIILVYLFGPMRLELPNADELSDISPDNAVRCLRCGDLGLINGSWPIIGEMKIWIEDKWPMPNFVHKESLSNRILIRKYSDSDPSKLEGQASVASAGHLEQDGLHGYEVVELILTDQLKPH
ncbi:Imm26 family immunity protein [Mesorhizobium carmichaelinearum]|uniref:Imm26 family immunity protein n=1 Tax=Mesorhizobium carmichaelinearum TaxID=1208188 RepID=UPI000BA2E604|nr:Imm26 family immunity protein [Mesorhizobium carmichaelinearum]